MSKFIKENKFNIFIFCFVFLIMLYSFLSDRGLLTRTFRWLTDNDYRLSIASKQHISVTENNIFEFWNYLIKKTLFRFDYDLIFSTKIFQLIIPFFGALSIYKYFNFHNSLFKYSLNRVKNYKKSIFKNIFKTSIGVSFAIFFAYLIIMLICYKLGNGVFGRVVVERDVTPRTLYLDILGRNFYYNHALLYWTLEGFTRFFIMPFIYTFFGCSIALISDNKKVVLIAPALYYFGFTILSFGLIALLSFGYYFSPSAIMASGDYNVNSFLMLSMAFIPFYIGTGIIFLGNKYVEKT